MTDRIIFDANGAIDEASIEASHVRMEHMCEGHWQIAITRPDGSRFIVNLRSVGQAAIKSRHTVENGK